MITGGIIETFEAMLSDVACLIVYMPLLMGTGGNSGSQSATLIIRGMAMGEISLKDFLKVVWKELRVSFVAGLALSLLNFLRVMYIDGNGFFVALTISTAMLVTVMVAKTVGGMLPMIAKAIGIDPALMAGPLVSSIIDMISLVIYFALATLILGI